MQPKRFDFYHNHNIDKRGNDAKIANTAVTFAKFQTLTQTDFRAKFAGWQC